MRQNYIFNRWFRSATLVVFTLLFARVGQANPDIGLFKNYFVTGDFATAGVGLRGKGQLDAATGKYLAQATITIPVCAGSVGLSCVPGDANGHPTGDIVAAFLYWESIEKTDLPSSALGYVANPVYGDTDPNHIAPIKCQKTDPRCTIVGKPLGAPHAAPCWSNGGSTGSSQGAPSLRVYREDVDRFLVVDPITKKKVPSLTVWLSDSGSGGSGVPLTEGATLVVVYRDPTMTYKGIVLMDGSFTINNDTDSLTVTMNQFFQAATTQEDVEAKISYAVGDGQPNFPERLWFGSNNKLTQLGTAPFTGSAGPAWDNLTYNVSALVPAGATSITTKIDHGPGSFDCLSLGFIGASVTVQDTDADGLLDVWESQGLKDPATGAVLVPLNQMGANPNHKDLYVEIDYMQDFAQGTAHSEKPSKEALLMVGAAFCNAPVSNPDGFNGINIHFDVGPSPYVDTSGSCFTDPKHPVPYILSTGLEGGDAVDERSASFFCGPSPSATCVFPNEPGVIFWKWTLAHIKQAHVPNPPGSSNLSARLYWNPARAFIFRWVLFGHSLVTRARDADRTPVLTTASGRADFLGRDLAVTLGKWSTRTKVNEAGTLIHELGHTLGLLHGGTAGGANCITNHVTSMNYVYQNAGIFLKNGTAVVDYSRETLPGPSNTNGESSLDEFNGLGSGPDMQYRLRWYAPRGNVATFLNVDPNILRLPSAYCGGAPLPPNFYNDPANQLVRVDGFGVSRTKIDWNYNGKTTDTPKIDLDFNGTFEAAGDQFNNHYTSMNDWDLVISKSNQGLRQVDVGRNLFGLSLGVTPTDLVKSQEIDLTQLGDLELGDLELGDLELGDLELGDLELGDLELGDLELGDLELGDLELGDLELGAADELDEPRAKDIGMNLAPSSLAANVTKQQGTLSVNLSWTAPPPPIKGGVAVAGYLIYRSNGSTITPPLTQFASAGTGTTFSDTTVGNNNTYTYFVIAAFNDGSLSAPSDSVTILAK